MESKMKWYKIIFYINASSKTELRNVQAGPVFYVAKKSH